MKPGRATISHAPTKKGFLAEFEKAFLKEYGKEPTDWQRKFNYKAHKNFAKWGWLAREKIY